jgi:hypothetical protein
MILKQTPQTKAALAILQAAIDRDKARKQLRYGKGFDEKPTLHDDLQKSLEQNLVPSKLPPEEGSL